MLYLPLRIFYLEKEICLAFALMKSIAKCSLWQPLTLELFGGMDQMATTYPSSIKELFTNISKYWFCFLSLCVFVRLAKSCYNKKCKLSSLPAHYNYGRWMYCATVWIDTRTPNLEWSSMGLSKSFLDILLPLDKARVPTVLKPTSAGEAVGDSESTEKGELRDSAF